MSVGARCQRPHPGLLRREMHGVRTAVPLLPVGARALRFCGRGSPGLVWVSTSRSMVTVLDTERQERQGRREWEGSSGMRASPWEETRRGGTLKLREYAVLARQVCFFQAEDGIRDLTVTGVQTCALPI